MVSSAALLICICKQLAQALLAQTPRNTGHQTTVFSYTVNKSTRPKHVSSAARDPVEDVTITRRYLSWDLLP